MTSKKISTKLKNILTKLSSKEKNDSSLNQNISSLSVDDFAVNIMSSTSSITADFTESYNTAEAERGKFVVSDTTHSTYTGYPSAGRGKYTMLTYEIQSADAVDFSESYNTAEAERGKFVKLDLDSGSTGYPSDGRGKYAVLTYNVNSTSSGGSSATELDDLTDVNITSPITDLQVLIYDGSEWVNGWPEVKMIQVRNDEGNTIPTGAPLYSKGEIGGSNRILVGIADANDSAKMPCIGIAYEEMNTTTTKDNFAVVSGVFNAPLNGGFTGLSVGDTVYVKNWTGTPTTASDVLTTTRPTDGTEQVQNVGVILKTNGTIIQGLLVSAIGRANDIPNAVITTNSSDADYVYIDDGNAWKKITPANLGIGGGGSLPPFYRDWEGTRFSANGGPLGAGASPSPHSESGTNINLYGAAFDDAQTETAGPFRLRVPDSVDNTADVEFHIRGYGGDTNNVKFQIEHTTNGDNSLTSTASAFAASTSKTAIAENTINVNMTLTAGDELIFYLSRLGADAADTSSGDFIVTILTVEIGRA